VPDYPQFPTVSSVSAPMIIDEVYRYTTDQSYEIRRSKHSRPRRRYTLEYLGKQTYEMRLLRDFFGTVRFGALPFTWVHNTAEETVTVQGTTPVTLSYYPVPHGLLTGQWVAVMASPGNAVNGGWRVTRVNPYDLTLDGSVAGGAGSGQVRVYLPMAVGVFAQDAMTSPTKLIGPEAGTRGYWNITVEIEELYA
jgi:hypothetical protein